MSSPISIKNQPVISRLHDALDQAAAYAAAVADNAIDDQQPIPADVVSAIEAVCNRIIASLKQ